MSWNFTLTYNKMIINDSYATIRNLLNNQLSTEFSIFQLRIFVNFFKKLNFSVKYSVKNCELFKVRQERNFKANK